MCKFIKRSAELFIPRMATVIKEINIPLNDIRHLFLEPDCDPFVDRNLTISGLDYAVKQLRAKPLPEQIQLNLTIPNSTIDAAEVKDALRRHCLNIVQDKEEESCYLNSQIESNFKRALLPFLIMIIAVGSIMYHFMDDRSRFMQTLILLLNNCLIIMGWVLIWIPAEMFLYDAPRLRKEIALYKLLSTATIHIKEPFC